MSEKACSYCGDLKCESECVFDFESKKKRKNVRPVDNLDDILVDKWEPGLFDANDAIIPTRDEDVARTQALQRTDPMVAGNFRQERAQTIGARVRMAYRPDFETLGLDTVWQDEISEQMENLWELYMEDPYNCYNDASGMSDFSGQMGLCMMEFQSTGEVLGVFKNKSKEKGRPFDSALSIIDSSRLVTPPEYAASGSVKKGVRVNSDGKPIKWYIHREHPHGFYKFSQALRRQREEKGRKKPRRNYDSVDKMYPWGKPKLFHYFDRERAGQNRAKPHIASALRKIKGLQQYDDVTLQAAYRDAVFAVWMESQDPNIGQAFATTAGAHRPPEETYKKMHLAAKQVRNLGNERRAQLGGRDVTQFTPGETLHSMRGGFNRQGQQEFVKSFMWHFAKALEVDPASWSGDFTDQSFSSIRASLIATLASRNYKQNRILRACGYPCFSVFLEEMIAGGYVDMPISSNRRIRHLDYFYKNRRALSMADFYGPGQDFVDQIKGQKMWESRVQCGMGTRTDFFRKHTDTTLREYAREAEREERLLKDRNLGHMIKFPKNNTGLPQTQNDRVAQERSNES